MFMGQVAATSLHIRCGDMQNFDTKLSHCWGSPRVQGTRSSNEVINAIYQATFSYRHCCFPSGFAHSRQGADCFAFTKRFDPGQTGRSRCVTARLFRHSVRQLPVPWRQRSVEEPEPLRRRACVSHFQDAGRRAHQHPAYNRSLSADHRRQ